MRNWRNWRAPDPDGSARRALLALVDGEDVVNRAHLADALGVRATATDREVIRALDRMRSDEDPLVRVSAAWALERAQPANEDALETLGELARHPSSSVRAKATSRLGELSRPSPVAARVLGERTTDPEPMQRG